MTSREYTEPVKQLLTYGSARDSINQWPDYLALGFTEQHVDELIAMVTDEDLYWSDHESKEIWASLHAWRTLGQLKAVKAIEPLLTLFDKRRDDDWVYEELPEVFAMHGAVAIEPLENYLADSAHNEWSHVAVINALRKIAEQNPEEQPRCVDIFAERLNSYAVNTDIFNTFLIDALVGLEDVEHIDLIEKAFAADAVDCAVRGDFEDVQIDLGLLEERITPKRNYLLEQMMQYSGSVSKTIVKENKIGRNDPCPCGSGKKYKKCCLNKE